MYICTTFYKNMEYKINTKQTLILCNSKPTKSTCTWFIISKQIKFEETLRSSFNSTIHHNMTTSLIIIYPHTSKGILTINNTHEHLGNGNKTLMHITRSVFIS